MIIPAFFLQMIMMFPSGTEFCIGAKCGIHFWGVHNHDAMWHLEIAATAFKSFPFQVPTFSGAALSGYNVLMDLVLYIISFVGIPPIITLFKIVPVLWFVSYTLVAIELARSVKNDSKFVALVLFLLYFADSFGYLLYLYHEGSLYKGGQSFSLQSMTALLNTQFALTLPLLMMQLVFLKKKLFSPKYKILMGLLVFLSFGLKFYGGVVSSVIAGWYIVEEFIENRRFSDSTKSAVIIGISGALSILIFYNPFAAQTTGSVFTFSPFATVHSVIEAPDMLYKPDMVNARYYLYEHGWSPRLVYIELFSTMLYFFLNFGTRSFGIVYILGKGILRKFSRFELYILFTVMIAFFLNIMLIQKGDWWNTVQFGYYAIFLSNIFLALLLYDLLASKRKILMVLAGIIILLTIPSILRTLNSFASLDTSYISRKELDAMAFLKKEPDGVIFNSFIAHDGYSFLDYTYSGYVTAFTGKQTYLAHLGPLNIIGIDAKERNNRILSNDCTVFNEVEYIYKVKAHKSEPLKICKKLVEQKYNTIYSNSEVVIYGKKIVQY